MVDPENGPYFSLEQALENVEPFTTIYLVEGVYTCSTPINKPGIIIQKRDIEREVYIVGNEKQVLRIELEQEDYVVFKDLIITHSGMCLTAKFKENAPNEPKYTMEPSQKCIREFEINPEMDTICYVKSGGVMFRNCTMTLKSHKKKLKSRIPILVAFPRTFINLTSC